jgi:hypothetical protein
MSLSSNIGKPSQAYGTRDSSAKCCGTCRWSYGNCSAVGVRLGCWKRHVGPLSFAMPDDLVCSGKDWERSYGTRF